MVQQVKRPESKENQSTMYQVLRPDGGLSNEEPEIEAEMLVGAYRNMVLTRMLDDKMNTLQRQGRMGTYVSCSGQEATQVGAVLALSKSDWIFPMYRDLGMIIQIGVKIGDILDRLFGNAKDLSLGRDLPNVYGWRKNRVFSLAAPIASQVCPAVGFAMAAKMKRDNFVTLSSFGDGATSSSEFHASMNFAGVYKAPVIFICENNQYAISVPVGMQTASESIAVKARAYGFEGLKVDGNDLLAVYRVVSEAAEKARRGEGPMLIECYTYRMGSHSTSDDWKKYRPVDEVEEWRKRDPIKRIKIYLENKKKIWSETEEQKLKTEFEEAINSEVNRAESTPPPAVETMFDDVYAKLPRNLIEQSKDAST
ncbi:MAG: pyruvate dehydrogenase (acetyl-transferring) E1 component subunit alpha [Nitrososphaerales archaeon]